jgi:hypothetical protein
MNSTRKIKAAHFIATLLALLSAGSLRAADVSRFLVVKGQEFLQTNATTVVSIATNKPFRFNASVEDADFNSVLSAVVKLPNAQLRALTNNSGLWEYEAAFANKPALDAGYGAGSYGFTIVGQNDGTNKPVLALPADNYPPAPKILNWDDLQSVEAAQPLNFSWGTFTNGSTNDMILLEVGTAGGATVATTPALLTPDALNGTNLAAQIPAYTLADNTAYEGRLLFLKRTALSTNYPGAKGAAGFFRETKFPVVTLPAPPSEGRIQFSATSYTTLEDVFLSSNTVIVTRSGGVGEVSVVVHASLTNYFLTDNYLTFSEGETSKPCRIQIFDDPFLFGSRTVNLSLDPPTGGAVLGSRATAVLTVLDKEVAAAGQFEFATRTNVVSEAARFITLTVRRVGGSKGAASVEWFAYAANGDTALPGLNFIQTNGLISFGPGITSRTITVPIVNNSIAETNPMFHAILVGPTGGAALGTNFTTPVTIINDDFGGTLAFKQTSYVTNENSGNFFVAVTRTGGAASGVTVDYFTQDGTAQAWQRYVPTSGTLTFGSNEVSKIIQVPIINNTQPDGDQSFTLTLANATGGAAINTNKATATLTVLDDESSVAFTNATFTVSEGVGKLTATVVRTGTLRTQTAVTVGTADISAVAGRDYRATNVLLVFPPNVKAKTFSVGILDNALVDGDRSFQLSLANPTNGVSLGLQNTAVVTITNNDIPGVIEFGNYKFDVAENGQNALITIVRHDGSASGVSVDFTTADGDATAGINYSNASQTVTFGAGETSKKVLVPIIDNTDVDGDRSVLLSLANPTSGATLGDLAGVPLTIHDDDHAGTFNFVRKNYSAREDAGNFLVNVFRTGGKGGNVAVDYFTSDGTAVAAANYVPAGGTLTFAAGETNKTIFVGIINDTLAEGVQNFFLNLTNATADGSIGLNGATELTIVDDEASFCISNTAVSVSEAAGSVVITVVRTGPLTDSATVKFTTTNLTATAGADYGGTNVTLTFAPHVASRTVTIPILNDQVIENDEQFNCFLSNPSANIPLGVTTNEMVTIIDDDLAGSVQFSSDNFSGVEGSNAVITLTRTGGLVGGVSVYLLMNGGTAISGVDYANQSGYVTFAPGQTSTNITVPIVLDPLTEDTETVGLSLVAPLGGLVVGTPGAATLNIADKHDPNAIPEAGPVFLNVTLNGANITGLNVNGTNYSDLAGAGLDSYLNFSGTRNVITGATNTFNAFTFANLVANGPGVLNFPGNSLANGEVAYTRYDVSFTGGPIINAVSSQAGASGTLTIDVLNKISKTATGRFDLNLVDGLIHQTYHVTGSFRVRW